MTTKHVIARFGIEVLLPEGWHIEEARSNQLVVAVPAEFARRLETAPMSVSIGQTSLPDPSRFLDIVKDLMRARIGQGTIELLGFGRGGRIESDWTDGVQNLASLFVRRLDSFIEIIYGVDPLRSDLKLEDLKKAVLINTDLA